MFNTLIFLAFLDREQPPSRGCVLKLKKYVEIIKKERSRLRAAVC